MEIPTPKNTPGETPPNEPNTSNGSVNNLDTSIFNSILNFQQLQLLVIERMEPVSRHSVTLDFGFQVALTDIIIPACAELSSISIDAWSQTELKDSRRICLSSNINEVPIILNDLQQPLTCRYLKLIMVAYSTNIVKAKIPIGYYFGYPLIYHHHHNQQHKQNSQLLEVHLNYLGTSIFHFNHNLFTNLTRFYFQKNSTKTQNAITQCQ
jgi:baculoviral IAP repeat-containing protein 6